MIKRERILYSLSRDQLKKQGSAAIFNECNPNILLVEFLVHSQNFSSFIRFNGVPRSWVALGPYDWNHSEKTTEIKVTGNEPVGPSARRPKYHDAPTTTPPRIT